MAQRILVIDDDAAILRCMTLRLEQAGYLAATATDGIRGERLARECPPDLVLLDLRMPQRDGRATLAALRAAPETRDVPVILLSGAPDDCDAGAADLLLTKPCPAPELIAAIRQVLQQKSAQGAAP